MNAFIITGHHGLYPFNIFIVHQSNIAKGTGTIQNALKRFRVVLGSQFSPSDKIPNIRKYIHQIRRYTDKFWFFGGGGEAGILYRENDSKTYPFHTPNSSLRASSYNDKGKTVFSRGGEIPTGSWLPFSTSSFSLSTMVKTGQREDVELTRGVLFRASRNLSTPRHTQHIHTTYILLHYLGR